MMGRWLERAKTAIFPKTAPTPCAEIAEINSCTNCTPHPAHFQKNPTDTANYRATLEKAAGVPFDWMLAHYFTDNDLVDMDRGLWPDPAALGAFIKTDWRYPFGWSPTAPVAAPVGDRPRRARRSGGR
jgi:hypothetical protein